MLLSIDTFIYYFFFERRKEGEKPGKTESRDTGSSSKSYT